MVSQKGVKVYNVAAVQARMEYIGGQALIEGVMILSKERVGIALAKGTHIKIVEQPRPRFSKRFEKVWFVRGIVALAEMLYIGTKALLLSAEEAAVEEEGKDKKNSEKVERQPQSFGMWEILIGIALPIVVAIALFIAAPFFLASLMVENGVLFNVIEGIIRVIIFVAYLVVIAQFKDIQRVFQYHGAEHMAVHCHEAGKKLSVAAVRDYAKEHPRCGTSFLILVLLIAIVVFSFVTTESKILQVLARIILIPAIAGISYEILKIGAKFQQHLWMRPLILPGIWVQRITTATPDDQQIRVAIAAVNACVRAEKKL